MHGTFEAFFCCLDNFDTGSPVNMGVWEILNVLSAKNMLVILINTCYGMRVRRLGYEAEGTT